MSLPRTALALENVTLYVVTDSTPALAPLEAFIKESVLGGVGMVQLREKRLTDKELLVAAARCAACCNELGVPFIVNDRLDIALACGADGVHLGQDDLPVEAARRLCPHGFLVGLSTHSAPQIDRAVDQGADYIGVGPVHATPTKEGRSAVGCELVRYAAEHASMPFFAIGGLDPSNVQAVIEAGGTRVSVLRWVSASPRPAQAARAVLESIARAQQARQLRA